MTTNSMTTDKARIGTVWDNTVAVIGGRTRMIAVIAALALFVPTVLQSAISLYLPVGALKAGLGGLVSLAAALLSIWGSLAILAIATDPATDLPDARRQATARLLPVIGVTLVLSLLAILVTLPIVIALAATGFDFQAATLAMETSAPALMPKLASSAALFISLYSIALTILAFWAGARLMLVNAVVLNERRGVGAIRRSIALSRGLTWKLIGVLILFLIVLVVATFATQAVVGTVFRLILGAENITTALFLASVAVAVVTAAFVSLAYVFTAQLYVATRESPIPE